MNDKIIKMNLEDIMGERFGRYSKYIIQDRALPDIRDGLKPVQRRILYAMNYEGNTFDKAFRKSAKTVGNVIGNYHPHGDTSVYDAMVRLSQDFKLREPLIEMHGNNGSIDGDSAAAMRYTEARLSKISSLLLEDIKKDTVDMVYNFDDTLLEPTVLPSKYPNLLVNGSSGISAGYATNIPPHNLSEILNALIFLINNPNCRVETLFKYIQGPDFPTGGIVSGRQEIIDALSSGKGRVVIKSTYEITNVKNKKQIIISEIPYEVNKANLVYKIDEVRELKKVEGIKEVRDESDKSGIRIVIDLNSNANEELVINYLLKNTDLQIYYSYNIVAIVNRKPIQVGIKEILEAYLTHQQEVLLRRCKYDLVRILKRLHIIDGLVIALSDIDLLVSTIRKSRNKSDAIINVGNVFSITQIQAEAIVNLQLYRLTNTDINELMEEKSKLEAEVEILNLLINNKEELNNNLISMFKQIIKDFGNNRKTIVEDTYTAIKIDEKDLITNDEVIITITKDGYVKKTSARLLDTLNFDEYRKKDDDYLIVANKCFELNYLLCFTSKGNYIVLPIYELEYKKWKDLGEHISQYILMKSDDIIVSACIVSSFDENRQFMLFTNDGYAKRVNLKDLEVLRYNKQYTVFNINLDAVVVNVEENIAKQTVVVSNEGFAFKFNTEDISIQGAKSKGVKVMNTNKQTLLYGGSIKEDYLVVITNQNNAKRYLMSDIIESSRGSKGKLIISVDRKKSLEVKNVCQSTKDLLVIRYGNNIDYIESTAINICDDTSNGKVLSNHEIYDVNKAIEVIQVNEIKNKKTSSMVKIVNAEEISEHSYDDIVELNTDSIDVINTQSNLEVKITNESTIDNTVDDKIKVANNVIDNQMDLDIEIDEITIDDFLD